MTRLVLLSDTHGFMSKIKVPDGDILLHSGDICYHKGTPQEVEKEFKLIGKLPHKYKVVIAGNHDFPIQDIPGFAKQVALENGIIYLENSSVELEFLNIYGSPWTPWFFSWAFNFEEQNIEQAQRCWANIPDNTNVLITHGPPRKILDRTPDHYEHLGRNVGCGQLFSKTIKLPNLLLHSFGHIHCSYGYENFEKTLYVNASICTEQYRPTNPAYVVDIDTVHMQVEKLTNAKENLENSAHT